MFVANVMENHEYDLVWAERILLRKDLFDLLHYHVICSAYLVILIGFVHLCNDSCYYKTDSPCAIIQCIENCERIISVGKDCQGRWLEHIDC